MRESDYDVLEVIKNRWSPRAFSSEVVPREEIMALLESARFAPSCFNEQPWRFMIPADEDELELFRGLLAPKNQLWANKAPWLVLILSHKLFARNNQSNRWNQFDTGTAWGFLSLEAVHRGLVTHAMAGFNAGEAREKLRIPEEFDVMAMVAIGKYGELSELPEELQSGEKPGLRRPLNETVIRFK